MKTTFIDQLCTHLKAGTPVMYVNTDETIRLLDEVKRAAWKTSDGTKIALDEGDAKKYYKILSKYDKNTDSYLKIDVAEPTIKFDSTWLTAVADKVDKKLAIAKNKNDYDEIFKEYLEVEAMLNLVYNVVDWNLIDGFSEWGGKKEENPTDVFDALKACIATPIGHKVLPDNCVIVMRDCHPFLNTDNDPRYRGMLKNLVEKSLLSIHPDISHHILFVQPDWMPHRDIQSNVTAIEFLLPNEEQLDREINYIQQSIQDVEKRGCQAELRSDLARSMRGFTQSEASSALAYCVAAHGGFHPDMIRTIHKLQKAAFNKTGVLNMIDDDTIAEVDQVGGFENYLNFIDDCILSYSEEAKKVGLDKSKGCLLLGIPGTGKSLVAKVTAKKMKLPLLVYDFAAQFGSMVGQTESTQRQVLKQITAKGPCVVLLDEADKIFSGVVGGFQGDTGVSLRAFGRLMTWMAEENQEAFVIMTMNRTIGIPPEALRAGRLDAIFYTTFPSLRERIDIMGIHLKKRGAKPEAISKSKWEELAVATDRYVGAELEQLVKKAIRTAFKERKELTPTFDELIAAKSVVTPVVKLDQENIDAIERFCKDTATPVSSGELEEAKLFKSSGRNIRLGPSTN